LWRTVSREKDLMLEQGQRVKRKGRQRTCDELTTASIPCPPVPLRGNEVENLGAEPGKKGGVG